MKFQLLILLISSYLLAFSLNFIPSLKYPDINMSIISLLVTLLFLIALLIFIFKMPYRGKLNKGLKVFLIVGLVSGFVIYVAELFADILMESAILDTIASIQYPLYLLFTTPLFGVNYLFDMNHEVFSLLMSAVYALALILMKKVDTKNM